MDRHRLHLGWPIIALLVLSGCGSLTNVTSSVVVAGFQFTSAPLTLTAQSTVSQRGYDGTSGIRPEVDFWAGGPVVLSTDVLAPAAATVSAITASPTAGLTNVRIDFASSSGVRFYLTRLASASVTIGQAVTAGQVVGKFATELRQGAIPFGLGVIDTTRTIAFVRPERYSDDVLHGQPALDYFTSALRTELTNRLSTAPVSSLECDIAGTLQGLWFLEGQPVAGSTDRTAAQTWLWFVPSYLTPGKMSVRYYQNTNPETVLYGIGSDIPATDPAPLNVTSFTGQVTYHFTPPGAPAKVLLIEMLSNARVQAEAFDAATTPLPKVFTSASRIFVR